VGDAEIGPETLERAQQHPDARFIFAHCAVGAFELVVPQVEEFPNVYFDTSWWNPADAWALFRLVPPARILYASDIPFASPAEGLVLTGRIALQAGLTPEQIRGVMVNERTEDPDPLRSERAPGFDLVLAAAVAARTPSASSPSLDQIRELSAAA